jgi:hypothetical protein
VLEHIGAVAYRLQLPNNSAVHPIIHVSQLKLASRFKGMVSHQLPFELLQFHVLVQVLATIMVSRGGSQITQVLVWWYELPDELMTWEDVELLKQKFPFAHAWGEVVLQEERNASVVETSTPSPRRSIRPKKRSVRVSGLE